MTAGFLVLAVVGVLAAELGSRPDSDSGPPPGLVRAERALGTQASAPFQPTPVPAPATHLDAGPPDASSADAGTMVDHAIDVLCAERAAILCRAAHDCGCRPELVERCEGRSVNQCARAWIHTTEIVPLAPTDEAFESYRLDAAACIDRVHHPHTYADAALGEECAWGLCADGAGVCTHDLGCVPRSEEGEPCRPMNGFDGYRPACARGLRCARGICVRLDSPRTCVTGLDCPMPYACLHGWCGPPRHDGEACDDDEHCRAGSRCRAGRCERSAVACEGGDCRFGEYCDQGVCVPGICRRENL